MPIMWNVTLTRCAYKQLKKLPNIVNEAVFFLMKDIRENGPSTSGAWKNYGKLKGMGGGDKRHCHLKKGSPTYVCCWEVIDKTVRIVEVYYVGTHEKASY